MERGEWGVASGEGATQRLLPWSRARHDRRRQGAIHDGCRYIDLLKLASWPGRLSQAGASCLTLPDTVALVTSAAHASPRGPSLRLFVGVPYPKSSQCQVLDLPWRRLGLVLGGTRVLSWGDLCSHHIMYSVRVPA